MIFNNCNVNLFAKELQAEQKYFRNYSLQGSKNLSNF